MLRGGYGIFFLPLAIARRENLVEATATGSSPFLGSLDGGRTPYRVLSNPFPDGITQPVGRDANLQRVLTGQVIPTTVAFSEHAYSQQWNFNVQRNLPGNSLVEVAYVGLKGTKLPVNVYPSNTLSAETLRLGTALVAQTPNPFFGLVSRGVLSTPTVAKGQLLRPFPQFDNVTVRGFFIGNSNYHSMQLKVQKRFQAGAGVLLSYTASKLITDTESQTSWLEPTAVVQNPYDMRMERSLSSSDVPQRLVISGNFDLPFGRGKRFLGGAHGLGGKLISGWVINGIYTAQKGVPLFLTTAANQTGSLGGGSRPNSSAGAQSSPGRLSRGSTAGSTLRSSARRRPSRSGICRGRCPMSEVPASTTSISRSSRTPHSDPSNALCSSFERKCITCSTALSLPCPARLSELPSLRLYRARTTIPGLFNLH